MARIHGADGRIYVNQYNLSGRANTLDLNLALPTKGVTAFEDAAETFVQGKSERAWDATFRAASDFTAAEIDSILNALVTATTVPLWGLYFDGSAAGSRGYEGAGWLDRDSLHAPRNNAGMLDAQVKGGGPYYIGRAMKLNEATVISGTGNQTGQNHMSAASGDRVVLVVRVTAVAGAGSATLKVQESSDNGVGDAYADVAGMGTLVASAVGASYITVLSAATLGPWWRLVCTAFSGTSVTVRVAVAIIPGG